MKVALPAALESAQCGGWDRSRSIGKEPGEDKDGLIAKVRGVPGREGEPLGNRGSGMAKRREKGGIRDDGFLFPDTAEGMATACEPGQRLLKKRVWSDEATTQNPAPDKPPLKGGSIEKEFTSPFFEDAPCRWPDGKETDPQTPGTCATFCSWLNDRTTEHEDHEESTSKGKDGQEDPGQEKKMNPYQRGWTYRTCVLWEELTQTLPPELPSTQPRPSPGQTTEVIGYRCAEDGWRWLWLCTDGLVEKDPAISPPADTDSDQRNCHTSCKGAACRCQGPGCEGKQAWNGLPYRSFFRRYQAAADRASLPQTPNDRLRNVHGEIACYGFYDEFDPKSRKTNDADRRCVIGTLYDGEDMEMETSGLKESQKGKGKIRRDPLPLDPAPPPRKPAFHSKTDLWYPNLGGAFSFLSEPVFTKTWKRDLTLALLSPDEAQIEASVQVFGGEPYARESVLRAFDDTVTNARGSSRPFTQWWQQFQRDALHVLTPATVRLRLPSGILAEEGLSRIREELRDILTEPREIGIDELRGKPIDIQLTVREDLLGHLARFLKNFLLTVREEPVTVVVPLGSPVEYRALADRWKAWETERQRLRAMGTALPDVSPAVSDLIATLERYAVQIEEVRTLRGELGRYLGALMTRQSALTQGIGAWMRENVSQYSAFLARARERELLRDPWRRAQLQLARLQDEANFPWCRTDRFTIPIYSLLDPWLPGRPETFGGIPTCVNGWDSLPALCPPFGETDYTFDFSKLLLGSTAARFPVLKPVQIRLAIPVPGPSDDPGADLPASALTLPELPPIPTINLDSLNTLPAVEQRGNRPRAVSAPPSPDLGEFFFAFARAEEILKAMADTYQAFWESLGAPEERGELQCPGWGISPCVHTEMDLLERVMRIVARPAILLQEDLEHTGIARFPLTDRVTKKISEEKDATCAPDDHVCATLLPERKPPRDGWQVLPPASDDQGAGIIDQIRSAARAHTLNEDGTVRGSTPYIVPPQDLYPVFDIPEETRLIPSSP